MNKRECARTRQKWAPMCGVTRERPTHGVDMILGLGAILALIF